MSAETGIFHEAVKYADNFDLPATFVVCDNGVSVMTDTRLRWGSRDPWFKGTRFEDITIEGGGTLIKGALEVDQNGDLVTANFPVYSPSEGDKTTLKADRGQDGVVRVPGRAWVVCGKK